MFKIVSPIAQAENGSFHPFSIETPSKKNLLFTSAQTCLFTKIIWDRKTLFLLHIIMSSDDSDDSDYYEELEDSGSDSSDDYTSSDSIMCTIYTHILLLKYAIK